ncbi:30S ribosomal protein S7 [Candidatus Micrarchaeota archaeon]|nr:30S ribosomal protein S7 [Candidatus Micrarchaeota archaeon]MBI5176956.1 30S ribosomal protein S7 [Candidatus Micrarchaeota archaeon]
MAEDESAKVEAARPEHKPDGHVEAEVKLFGKYPYTGLVINDGSLRQYVSLNPLQIPHSFARHANKQFAKSKVNIVERLANKLMRGGTGEKLGGKVIRTHGKLQGKKSKAIKIIEAAFEVVERKTKQNPIQMLIRALENSAPREDVTRVRFGGIAYQVATDVSAQRRLDLALRNITLAAILVAFNKKTTLAEALADEIILAANGDLASFSVKRRNETERMARSAR